MANVDNSLCFKKIFYVKINLMDNAGGLNKTLVIGIAALIIIGAAVWWYFGQKTEELAPIKTSEDIVGAVTTPEIEAGSNPVQNKVPEINPIDRANPFKDAYRNPFE